MNMRHLFPTPVGIFSLDRALTDEERAFLMGQDQRSNTGNSTSKNNFILRDKAMTGLRQFIKDCVAEYFAATSNPKHDVHLRVTQSWLNYSKPGQFHHKHEHPNSFVSGCFYVNANPETDKIYFHRDAYQQIKLLPKEWNLYNSETWWLPVATGELILFPSSLTHSVDTVQGDDVRVSLAFNTFPVGAVGDELDLTGLDLGETHGAFR